MSANPHRLPRDAFSATADPLKFCSLLWPDVYFYKQQKHIIYSVVENDETYVPAGNMLGKDYVAGFLAVYFFITRHPCRIVTTSAKDDHLRVLWGEINRFISTARYPLDARKGGPLVVNHQDVRKIYEGEKCPLSYMIGMVASPDSIAAMQGHHVAKTGDGVPRTMFISDESSSVPTDYYTMAKTWFHRALAIGNTWPCDNFFKHAVKGRPDGTDPGGDLPRPAGRGGYYRKVIHIRATDSPNVRLALAQKAQGREPDGRMVVPGVKDWDEYVKNLATMDPIQRCVSLDAEWYEGAEVRLFPADWLERAEARADELAQLAAAGKLKRRAKAVGVDPAEGGDSTALAAVDEHGLLELVSLKTPDTSEIKARVIAFGKRWKVDPWDWVLDRGGGGKQVADELRSMGYPVRTVAFGESLTPDPRKATQPERKLIDEREDRYSYLNRRAEMYGELSLLLEPRADGRPVFALPRRFPQIRRQLGPFPKVYDSEGRLKLPPKRHPPGRVKKTEPCLIDLIGHSPDEADALALAVHGMLNKSRHFVVGAF